MLLLPRSRYAKSIASLVGALFLTATHFALAAMINFISVSDIHFDPLYDCPTHSLHRCELAIKLSQSDPSNWDKIFKQYGKKTFSAYHKDTNYFLLHSSLQALKHTAQNTSPQFVILPGDLFAHLMQPKYILATHDFSEQGYEAFLYKTLKYLVYNLKAILPGINVYATLGNNDSYSRDYATVPNGKYLSDSAKLLSTLLVSSQNKREFQKDYPHLGYYEITLPHEPTHRLIALNTTLFSTNTTLPFGSHLRRVGTEQLNWLQQQLSTASKHHEKVWLLIHIPLGIDVYATQHSYPFKVFHLLFPRSFWKAHFVNAFLRLLNQYPAIVKIILAGHTHMDAFEWITLKNNPGILLSITPSISPVNGNNPGFKVYTYDSDTFEIKSFTTYRLDISQPIEKTTWRREYSFNTQYFIPKMEAKSSGSLSEKVYYLIISKQLETGHLSMQYQKFFNVGSIYGCIEKTWLPYYWCALWNITGQDYKRCVCSLESK